MTLDVNGIIKKSFRGSVVDGLLPYFEECFDFAEINTPDRLQMYLAQVGHESMNMTVLEENLNYSSDGMANMWPKIFAIKDIKTGKYVMSNGKYLPNDLAKTLHRKPEQIANIAYANKNGNGTSSSGDGWRYRGGGLLHVTFKGNYRECTKYLWKNLSVDFVDHPEYIREYKYAVWSSVWFWRTRNINSYSDKRDIRGATRVINGAYTHIDKRTDLYNKIGEVIKLF